MPVNPDVLAALERVKHLHRPQDFAAIVSRFDPALAVPEPPSDVESISEPRWEFHGAGDREFAPDKDSVVFYRLESNGDLLVILPAMKRVAMDLGRSVTLVTYRKYIPLMLGYPWLNVVGVEGMSRDQAKAALPHLGEARDLEPDHTRRSWSLAAFARTGVDVSLYDVLPLEIENRDPAAEAEVLRRYRRDGFRPLILLNTVGKSSPFAAGDVLRGWLAGRYVDDFEIVDLAFVRPKRIIDLMGLYEQACCIISTDTGTLHLAYATGTPTIALARDKEGPDAWGASEPRSHWIARVPYTVAGERAGLEQIAAAIDSLFYLPEKA